MLNLTYRTTPNSLFCIDSLNPWSAASSESRTVVHPRFPSKASLKISNHPISTVSVSPDLGDAYNPSNHP